MDGHPPIAPSPEQVEVLERKPERIHDAVTARAGRICAVQLQALAHRVADEPSDFAGLRRKIRFGARRRARHFRAEQALHEPLAAHDRRRAVRRRRRRQNAAVTEQAAPRAVRRPLDAPHLAAAHAVDAVVRREALVEIRVVRVEQRRARCAARARDRRTATPSRGASQRAIHRRIRICGTTASSSRSSSHWLAKFSTSADERASASMRSTWAASTAGSRAGPRPRAPEARRPECCSRERTTTSMRARIVDLGRRRRRQLVGLALEAIQESRVDEQARQRVLDAGLEVAALLASQRDRSAAAASSSPLPAATGRRYARVASRERICSRARALRPAGSGRRRRFRAGSACRRRPSNRTGPTIVSACTRAAERDLAQIQLVDAGAAPLVDERDGDAVRTRRHAQAKAPRILDGDGRAVERDVDGGPVAVDERARRVIPARRRNRRGDDELVLASSGKVCSYASRRACPAASPSIGARCAAPPARRVARLAVTHRAVADGAAADLHRSRRVAFEQRRRDTERLGVVVEPRRRLHRAATCSRSRSRRKPRGRGSRSRTRCDSGAPAAACRDSARAPTPRRAPLRATPRTRRAPRARAAARPSGGMSPVRSLRTTASPTSAWAASCFAVEALERDAARELEHRCGKPRNSGRGLRPRASPASTRNGGSPPRMATTPAATAATTIPRAMDQRRISVTRVGASLKSIPETARRQRLSCADSSSRLLSGRNAICYNDPHRYATYAEDVLETRG